MPWVELAGMVQMLTCKCYTTANSKAVVFYQMRDYLSDKDTLLQAKLMQLFDGKKSHVISSNPSCCDI